MQAPIITLVTDWGSRDFYGGLFKGHLLSELPDARVVDIAHGIEPFDTIHAASVVGRACPAFPEGTIHIVDVASSPVDGCVVALIDGRYYICADNGMLFNAFGRMSDKAVHLDIPSEEGATFVADRFFLPLACRLARGERLEQLGVLTSERGGSSPRTYIESGDRLSVTVTHVDGYGNAHLGITRQEFERIRAGRSFQTRIHDNPPLCHIMSSYTFAPGSGSLIIVESCTGHLQVAVCQASAQQLLGLKPRSSVIFEFK